MARQGHGASDAGRPLMLRALFVCMRSFYAVWQGTGEQAASLAEIGATSP